ncbi:Rrf2 family transcriptional regulator [Planctomicrobium sp. SH661]|uniref:Rrf2 family transcriptional regulator n=1 Tax=Planctomicrobium sp. SH661 TaxID=3448124 RepID=UPI003F5C01E5
MLSKTAEYALRVMAWLAGDDRQAESADKLAERTQIPRRYLQKVLQDLVSAGLITSRPGPGGGYLLAHAPAAISILDVVNAVDPLQRIRHCPLGLKSHTSLCPLHAELDRAYAATESAFAGVTLSDVIHSTSQVVPLCDFSPEASSAASNRKRK